MIVIVTGQPAFAGTLAQVDEPQLTGGFLHLDRRRHETKQVRAVDRSVRSMARVARSPELAPGGIPHDVELVQGEALAVEQAPAIMAGIAELVGGRTLRDLAVDFIVATEQEAMPRAVGAAGPVGIVVGVAVRTGHRRGSSKPRYQAWDRPAGGRPRHWMLRPDGEAERDVQGNAIRLQEGLVGVAFQADFVLSGGILHDLPTQGVPWNLSHAAVREVDSLVRGMAIHTFGMRRTSETEARQQLIGARIDLLMAQSELKLAIGMAEPRQ